MKIAINLGFPILCLLLSIFWTIWFSIAYGKRKLSSKTIVNWLLLNIISLSLSIYILIVGIIETKIKLPEEYHFINYLSKKLFGLDGEWAWIIWMILLVSFIAINISINVMIKINELNKKIDELNRTSAILKGKITLQDSSYEEVNTSEISLEDYKRLLDEYLAKEKLRIKYERKINNYREKFETYDENKNIKLDTKTLLNITDTLEIQNLNNDKKKESKNEK